LVENRFWSKKRKKKIFFGAKNFQKFKNSKIQKFKNSKIQKFKNSKIQKFKNSKIQKFKNLKIQKKNYFFFENFGAKFIPKRVKK